MAWKYKPHRSARIRALLRHWPTLRYFLFAGVGALAAYLATRAGGFNQWAYAILATVMIAAALLSLWHGEALKIAERVRESWIRRINADSEQHRAVDDAP